MNEVAKLLIPAVYDAVTDCAYDANFNLTHVEFRVGGLAGAVVGVLDMTYDANNNMLTAKRK